MFFCFLKKVLKLMDLDEISLKLREFSSRVEVSCQSLNESSLSEEFLALSTQMSALDFWQNPDRDDICERSRILKAKIVPWQQLRSHLSSLWDIFNFLKEDYDEELFQELSDGLLSLEKNLKVQEVGLLFSSEEDHLGAYLSINAGAGGTESCDWVSMLLRMFERFGSRKGMSVKFIESLPGEEVGIKNVTLLFRGEYAYGHLKTQVGVHRLVRISPFDSNQRRHTSFASVSVSPEIDENFQIDILDGDLKIDTYRAGGAGGQHVNKTDSAVRIKHIPSGIVVQCQNERSQHKNKASAMKILKSRLYELEVQKRNEEKKREHGGKSDIAWGSQICSYVFHPYTMVKDHRTEYQTGNALAVMDGVLDEFIYECLKKNIY